MQKVRMKQSVSMYMGGTRRIFLKQYITNKVVQEKRNILDFLKV